jgi:MSHA biogenesis protein MshM
MSSQVFGLTHVPLSKEVKTLWDDGQQFSSFAKQFQWLLDSPGIGVFTGEPGVGKTAALRYVTQGMNPHRYQLVYMPETNFGRVDLYRHLAFALGLEVSYRRAQLWRDIKERIVELYDKKNTLVVWIIDEAHNLPTDFFIDFPSFLNFSLDSRDIITVWFVGHSILSTSLSKTMHTALASRISVRSYLNPIIERERFIALLDHAFKEAGGQIKLLSDSGIEILRQASQGKPRYVSSILNTAMKLGALKGLNHFPDDLLQSAIEELR